MRSTFAPVPVAGVGAPLERPRDVLGEDAAQTMSFLVEQRRLQDEAAARELRAVAHWAELHQVDTRSEVGAVDLRSEEHTSELQSRQYLVCRLLLEKKKK